MQRYNIFPKSTKLQMFYRPFHPCRQQSLSTIVEITNILQTTPVYRQAASIYNSRNYKYFIDQGANALVRSIYNSRNYKCFIDLYPPLKLLLIYNSRNYKCFIDVIAIASIWYDLQQQKLQMFYRPTSVISSLSVSTIVEITNVLQTTNDLQ